MPQSRAVFILLAMLTLSLGGCSHGRIGIVSAEYAATVCSRTFDLPRVLNDAKWDALLRLSDIENDCPGVSVYEMRKPDMMQGPQTSGYILVRRTDAHACRWVISTHYPSAACGESPEKSCPKEVREAQERVSTFSSQFSHSIGKRPLARQGDFKIAPTRDTSKPWCTTAQKPQH